MSSRDLRPAAIVIPAKQAVGVFKRSSWVPLSRGRPGRAGEEATPNGRPGGEAGFAASTRIGSIIGKSEATGTPRGAVCKRPSV